MSLITVSKIQKESTATNIDVPSTGQFIDLASAAQGDVLYYNGTSYVRLAPGTSGQFLQTIGAGANPAWADAAGGITDASIWRLTTTFAGDANHIASNLEEDDGPDYVRLGSVMTVDGNGVFTFPSTGFWRIDFNGIGKNNAANNHMDISIASVISGTSDMRAKNSIGWSSFNYAGAYCSTVFDVSNTTTHKIAFDVNHTSQSNSLVGDTNNNETYFIFTRLADT